MPNRDRSAGSVRIAISIYQGALLRRCFWTRRRASLAPMTWLSVVLAALVVSYTAAG